MFNLNCRGRILSITKPIVMGVINTTPDSFYEGSRLSEIDAIVTKAGDMLKEGAAIIDIGGQSTRPGSNAISPEEEMNRVVPAIKAVLQYFPDAFISVDTYHAAVASAAVEAGAAIVNDVSGGTLDKDMISTVAALQVPYIAMHMKGTPSTMQSEADYNDVLLEVLEYFINKIHACKIAGIKDVIVDPGFGFAKVAAHNFTLLKNLSVFSMLQKPILAGLSRKSIVYKTLNITPDKALNGTTVLNTIALQNGATILRVHDVREAIEAIQLVQIYQGK